MHVHFDDSGAISFSYLLMLYTTPVVSFLKKMNNIKNDLVMQDLVNPLPFRKSSNNSPIQSKENQMEAVHLI